MSLHDFAMQEPVRKGQREQEQRKPFQATVAGFKTLGFALREAVESARLAREEKRTTPAEAEAVQLPHTDADTASGGRNPSLRKVARGRK